MNCLLDEARVRKRIEKRYAFSLMGGREVKRDSKGLFIYCGGLRFRPTKRRTEAVLGGIVWMESSDSEDNRRSLFYFKNHRWDEIDRTRVVVFFMTGSMLWNEVWKLRDPKK